MESGRVLGRTLWYVRKLGGDYACGRLWRGRDVADYRGWPRCGRGVEGKPCDCRVLECGGRYDRGGASRSRRIAAERKGLSGRPTEQIRRSKKSGCKLAASERTGKASGTRIIAR